MELFSEKSCFESFVQKKLEIGPKWGVSGITKNQCMELFLYLDEVTLM